MSSSPLATSPHSPSNSDPPDVAAAAAIATATTTTPTPTRRLPPHAHHGQSSSPAISNPTTPSVADEKGTPAHDDSQPASSPFLPSTHDAMESADPNQENNSPSKARHSRILSGNEPTPLRILGAQNDNASADPRSPSEDQPAATPRSARKFAPVKRFPIRVNGAGGSSEKPTDRSTDKRASKSSMSSASTAVDQPPTPADPTPEDEEREITLNAAKLADEGLAHAIKIFEDEDDTMMDNVDDEDVDMIAEEEKPEMEHSSIDNTMMSTFSTFSAVPNMTMFAHIGHSPTKFANMDATTPTLRGARPDPSPQRSSNSTNLLDFTEQMQNFSARYSQPSSAQQERMSAYGPSSRSNTISEATPKRPQSALLDFDIPPAPTPRSIPTITPRELETLKSNFLSEISGLKASLSGKEAEALSLKTAVSDAEKRVGECMEQLREAEGALAEQKDSWENRRGEMESVLRSVKDEILTSERSREELEYKLEESEKRREAAEIMAQEAESKMAGMRAGKASSEDPKSPKVAGTREVEIAVERVSRELHTLYKSKHESKVNALKKSYESRWEKRVQDLSNKVANLTEENERLRREPKVDPNASALDEERREQAVKDSAQIKELNAEIMKLGAVIDSVKADNRELRDLLSKERVEKGELVQLAEELMAMQQKMAQNEENREREAREARAASRPSRVASPSAGRVASPTGGRVLSPPPRRMMSPPPAPSASMHTTPNPKRRSMIAAPPSAERGVQSGPTGIARAHSMRAPTAIKKPVTTATSRFGAKGISERGRPGAPQAGSGGYGGGYGGGLPRPGSGTGMRSGIMSSIEKMGNYRGRD
ncbi:hypothetical protein F4780DRAFT_760589 [Xylariomycetidae sp. FL0641]|nr:hypothetical protein F4780DRAFT_760589 [Xylariomycetidae sp. FL0641]